MAVSAVDLRMLGALAEDTVTNNVPLSSCLFQILGLSVVLSQQLTRARSQRKLDYTRDTKSIKLYHHILWLAREGLSLTEVFILPYCQDGEQGPECRVMAAKLRASFYHIFCLFHNHPPVFQIKPSQSSTSTTSTPRQGFGFSNDNLAPMPQNVAGHRDSMVSESSYVTNPFAATSPPPNYPIPPLPTTPSRRDAPLRPPGFSPQQHSPPSNASFLLPPLNFVPATSNYFQIASTLARKLLRGAHPLRLSVTHEYTAFLSDCAKDYEGARQAAGDAVRAAYKDHTNLSDREWEDVLKMVRALTGIAKRAGGSSSSSAGKTSPPKVVSVLGGSHRTRDDSVLAAEGSHKTRNADTEESQKENVPVVMHMTFQQMKDYKAGGPLPAGALRDPCTKQEDKKYRGGGNGSIATSTGNSNTIHIQPRPHFDASLSPDMRGGAISKISTDERARRNHPSKSQTSRSQTSSRSSARRGRQEGSGGEKERKRRAVERAELEVSKRGSETSSNGDSGTDSGSVDSDVTIRRA